MKEFNGRRKAVIASLALFFFIFSTAPLRAQNGSAPRAERETRRGEGDRFVALRERLNLSPDQVEQIKAIREQNKDQWRGARQRVRQAQRALDEAIYADTADEVLIETRTREVAEAQTTLVRMRALTELKIRRVLTPEQLNTLRTLRQQRSNRMRENINRPHRRARPQG
ncbi:MAG: Spy/CpxP family protein refolding chaperone [Pyrinomonadaceae bacterium]